MNRANGTNSAKIISVIETKALRGLGTNEDPARVVTQYWDLEGKFLAENDVEHCCAIIYHDCDAIKKSIISD